MGGLRPAERSSYVRPAQRLPQRGTAPVGSTGCLAWAHDHLGGVLVGAAPITLFGRLRPVRRRRAAPRLKKGPGALDTRSSRSWRILGYTVHACRLRLCPVSRVPGTPRLDRATVITSTGSDTYNAFESNSGDFNDGPASDVLAAVPNPNAATQKPTSGSP